MLFSFFNPFILHNPHGNFTARSVFTVSAGGWHVTLLVYGYGSWCKNLQLSLAVVENHRFLCFWEMGSHKFVKSLLADTDDQYIEKKKKKEKMLADQACKNIIAKHILVTVLVACFLSHDRNTHDMSITCILC